MSGRLAEQTRNPLLDVACVMETLRRRLPECRTGLRLDGADLLDVRYLEGGRECAVGYRLRFTSLSGGGLSSQPVTLYRRDGRFFDTSRVADGYARVEERVLDAPLVDLPELGAVLRPFPIDPSLPGLLDAHDRGFMKTALRTCLDGRIRSVKVHHRRSSDAATAAPPRRPGGAHRRQAQRQPPVGRDYGRQLGALQTDT
jgi:hypothetical protein